MAEGYRSSFLDNFSLRRKLTAIALFASLPGFVLLWLLIAEKNIAIDFARKETYGTAYLRPLTSLLRHAGDYRTIVARFANGESDQSAALAETAKLVEADLAALDQVHGRLKAQLGAEQSIISVRKHWKNLQENLKQTLDEAAIGANDSLRESRSRRSAAFVASVRDLISHAGDKSNLILDPDLDSYYVMDAVLLKVPEALDLQAQLEEACWEMLRAGTPTAEQRTNLIVKSGLLRSNIEALEAGIRVAFENNPAQNLSASLRIPMKELQDTAAELLRTIDTEFTSKAAIDLRRGEFQTVVSDTRTATASFWDESANKLDELLELRIGGFRNRKLVALSSVGGVVLLIALLLYFMTQRMSGRVRELAQRAGKLATGNWSETDERVMGAMVSADEVGHLAESLLNMARKLSDYIDELKKTTGQLEEAKSGLEIKVEERTREIAAKNTELESTLAQLKAMQSQLVVQEKMASLGSLTAGIAHEIKNPLNFVNNFAELSGEIAQEMRDILEKESPKIDPKEWDYVQGLLDDLDGNVKKIAEHGKRADGIVRGMLDHSRGRGGERQDIDINAVVEEYAKLAYHGLRARDSSFNVAFETYFDSSCGQISAIPQDLSRVILNVVNNACYAAHQKKKQLGDAFSPTLTLRTRNLGESVEVRIRDNGKGISQANLAKIFEPFFTTKPTGEGTGLGLSICYDIVVQEHGGAMRAESAEGEYAEFIITLPKKGPAAA